MNDQLLQKVEYLPPTDEVIDQFASDVGERMIEGEEETRFIREFAHFFKIVARIQASALTRKACYDSEEKQ